MALLLTFLAEPLAGLMTAGEGAATYTAQYLRVVGWGFFGYRTLVTGNAAMNAGDRALWSITLSAARIALVYIPLAWAGVFLAGYTGILAAAVLASLAGAWGATVVARAVGLLDLDWQVIRGPALWLRGAQAN